MSLKGKSAIVTGGNTGIGKAIVLALAEQGANVCIDYVANEQATEELEKPGFVRLVRDVLDQLDDRWRGQDGYLVECARSNETISERLRILERIELHPREHHVRVVNATRHDVAFRRFLASYGIRVKDGLEFVEILDLELVNHRSHSTSSPLRTCVGAAIIPHESDRIKSASCPIRCISASSCDFH